jgi:hypothetical protein
MKTEQEKFVIIFIAFFFVCDKKSNYQFRRRDKVSVFCRSGMDRMNDDQPMKRTAQISSRLLLMFSSAAALLLCSPLARGAASYHDTVLADGPVAYYRLEELSGTTAVDSSGNGRDGTYTFSTGGSPHLGLPGIETNSIFYDAVGADYGYVDAPGTGLDGTTPFSAEFWVQPTSQPSSWTVPLEVAQYPNGWNVYISGADAGNGAASYFYLDMRPPIFNSSYPDTVQFLHWHHVVVTYDGSVANLYVNGKQHGPFTATGFSPAAGSHAHLGSGQGSGWNPILAGLDEVAFYTNVLTFTQITNHYQIGTNSFRATFTPASILANPASITNYSGLTVSFNVSANGTLPLHYHWYKNSAPVGPDAATYTFTAQYPADNNASIQVIVTNNYGSATSTVATLTVSTDLVIAKGPDSITRNVGSYAAFRPTAYGAVPITYQWYKGPTKLTGETNTTLWLSNVQLADDASTYTVAVSNSFTSSNLTATLNVQSRAVNVPLTGYAQIIAADHPVAYWRLDEPDGSLTAVDAVGTFDGSYSGPLNAVFTYQVPTGIPHYTNDPAIGLSNGATVNVPYALELNPDRTWSAEIWFMPSSLGADGGDYRVILSSQYNLYPNPYNGWYIYQQPNGTIAFVPQPGNGFIVAGPDDPAHSNLLVPGNWYHMVVSDDGVNFNVYLNGELRSSFPVSGIAFIPNGTGVNGDGTTGGGATVIGRRTDGAFNAFLGTADETAFYNYALTPAQVQAHFAGSVRLTVAKTGATSVQLSWPVGVLQSASNVKGPYSDVGGAVSPWSHTTTNSPAFYRVRISTQ